MAILASSSKPQQPTAAPTAVAPAARTGPGASLSLAEAWEYAARLWDEPKATPGYEAIVHVQRDSFGLCVMLWKMFGEDLISFDLYSQMMSAVPEHGSRFLWPTTLEGAKQRAAFCREQAEKCK